MTDSLTEKSTPKNSEMGKPYSVGSMEFYNKIIKASSIKNP